MNIRISSAVGLFCACRATSHFFLDPPEVRFGFFQNLSNLLLTFWDGEQAGVKREAVFQPLDHCVYLEPASKFADAGFHLNVQGSQADAPDLSVPPSNHPGFSRKLDLFPCNPRNPKKKPYDRGSLLSSE